MIKKYFAHLFLLFSLLITKPLHFLVPLDADGGFYAYTSWLVSAGQVLYRDRYDHKPPGLYYLLGSFFKFFGVSTLSAQIFSLLWSLVTGYFFFRLSRRFFNQSLSLILTGLLFLFVFNLRLSDSGLYGECFLLLPVILGFTLLDSFRKKGGFAKLFLVGFFFGLASIIKQTGAVFIISTVLFLGNRQKIKETMAKNLAVIFGFIFVWFSLGLNLVAQGTLTDFINQNLYFNSDYVKFSFARFLYRPWTGWLDVFDSTALLWLLAPVGFWWGMKKLKSQEKDVLRLDLCWLIGSLLGVAFGWRFFPHYFILVIPPLVLLTGWFLKYFSENQKTGFETRTIKIFIGIVLSVSLFTQLKNAKIVLIDDPKIGAESRVRPMVAYLNQNTNPDDYVYLWGSEERVLFQAKRRSPSKFFCANFVMPGFRQTIQVEFARELEQKKPKIIADTSLDGGWPPFKSFTTHEWQKMVQWVEKNYDQVEVVEGWTVYRLR